MLEIVVLFGTTLLCAAAGHAQQFSAWSAPVNLNALTLSDGTPCPAVVNTAFDENHPTISKDGLSLIFQSNRPGGSGGIDLWVTERDSLDDCWLPPVNLGPKVNGAFNDSTPSLTTDGHWLYFQSNRPTWLTADGIAVPRCGGADLYVSHRHDKRNDRGWETPVNLGCTINTRGFSQAGPLHFEDDATGIHFLYFTRLPIGASDVLFDIYVSTCTADLAICNTPNTWGPGVPVGTPTVGKPTDGLNSLYRDTRTAIRRRDGLEMILSTGRPGSLGSENLWVSTRATTQDQNWLPPVPINCDSMPGCPAWDPEGPLVNSPAFDGAPALSWDGLTLYFFSERTDLPGFKGGRDLYVSKRTKLPD
jgi:hypothetical protein